MQTSPSWSEQEVPSLTLLDMAKKKSKSSAMQYSLQMSSSKHMGKQARTRRRRHCYKRRRGALSEPAGIPPHLNTISWMLTRSLCAVLLLCAQPLLGTELREAESSGGSPRGGDFSQHYRFILEFRSVITGKSGQPSLIKINGGEGDLAQRSQEPVHNLFFPASPPIHQQLKRAWDDGQTQCSPSLRSLAPWNKAGP